MKSTIISSKEPKQNTFTLVDHLTELRKRLIISFIAVIFCTGICYVFIDVILEYLMIPGKGADFIYLSPPELFLSYLRISFILGIMAASPLLLLEIWLFTRPALSRDEAIFLTFGMFFGSILFLIGAWFSYMIILPLAMDFFIGHSTAGIEPMFSFGNYIGFITGIVSAFGIAFELPCVVIILTRLEVISPAVLAKSRKYVLLVIIILAAVLTPPDVVSQLLLAGPMLVLFEISILLSRIMVKRKSKPESGIISGREE